MEGAREGVRKRGMRKLGREERKLEREGAVEGSV